MQVHNRQYFDAENVPLMSHCQKLLDGMLSRPAAQHHCSSANIAPSQAGQDPTAQPNSTGASSTSAGSITATPVFTVDAPPAATDTNSAGGLQPGREYIGGVAALVLSAIWVLAL